RDLIYDVLSENEESLAIDLADLSRQPGIVWTRIRTPALTLAASTDRARMRELLDPARVDGLPAEAVLLLRPDGVSVLGPGGQVIVPGQPVDAATRARFEIPDPRGPAPFRETDWQGDNVLHHHAELRAGDQVFGRLDLVYSLAELRRGEELTRGLFYALAAGTFLLLLALLNLLLSRMVIAPVRRVSEAMSEASTGRLDRRLEVGPADEIGRMEAAFNAMAADLLASKRAIEDYSHNLELRVLERTRALRESEQALRTLKNHLETVLAHVATGVISLDAEGRIATLNDRAGEILGLSPEGVVGRALEEALPPRAAPLAALVQRARRGEASLEREQVDLRTAHGRRTLAVVVSPLPPVGDGPAGTVVVLEDLTQLLATQKLEAWKEAVERVIHEVKNPLTPVGLVAQTLRTAHAEDRARFDTMFPSAIEMILRSVQDLKALIDEFTRFYRLPRAVMRRHDVNALVTDVLAAYEQAPPEGITIRREMAGQLPPVEADAEQLRRVLLNVIGNGVEAMEGRGGALTVGTRASDGAVIVSVRDEGPGIEDVEKVFEPYFTTKAKGTGLGLLISRQIVEEHQGELRIESQPGAGTRVEIELPAMTP
ncbi:MAG TPA: ATP-binding protein, partial [Vicinamibacteria bacterium]|nr:ATP-binding protein [Vicinamibacteria bacterium]